MARFVISDMHGTYKAFRQCLERSGFDHKKDLLICLGDVCDGYGEVKECFNELLSIKNLVYIMGNHDQWFYQWMKTGKKPNMWLVQGGSSTIKSYDGVVKKSHLEFLEKAKYYHIIENMMFVHGGFDLKHPLEDQSHETFIWDRSLVYEAHIQHGNKRSISGFDKVFVGHTPTINYNSFSPFYFCEVMMIDTGAGWGQKLSIINIDTGDFFQSDPAMDLYNTVLR